MACKIEPRFATICDGARRSRPVIWTTIFHIPRPRPSLPVENRQGGAGKILLLMRPPRRQLLRLPQQQATGAAPESGAPSLRGSGSGAPIAHRGPAAAASAEVGPRHGMSDWNKSCEDVPAMRASIQISKLAGPNIAKIKLCHPRLRFATLFSAMRSRRAHLTTYAEGS